MPERLEPRTRLIQTMGFYSLGLICLLYSTFYRDFAELHIQLPFLNFPIFVGEIFLGLYVILLLSQAKRFFLPLKLWHVALFLSGVWILDNAFYGYRTYGPLAFRNAALFYYVFFVPIGFYLYRKEELSQGAVIFTVSALLAAKLFVGVNNFYIFPHLILSIILISKIKNKGLKFLLLLPLIYIPVRNLNSQTHFFPAFFFIGSRARVVGHILAFLFLLLTLSFTFSALKNKGRWLASGSVVLLLILFIYHFADPHALRSLTHFDEIARAYQESEALIKQRGYDDNQTLPVQLYTKENWGMGKVISRRVAMVVPAFKKEEKEKIAAVKEVAMALIEEQQAIIEQKAAAYEQEQEKIAEQMKLSHLQGKKPAIKVLIAPEPITESPQVESSVEVKRPAPLELTSIEGNNPLLRDASAPISQQEIVGGAFAKTEKAVPTTKATETISTQASLVPSEVPEPSEPKEDGTVAGQQETTTVPTPVSAEPVLVTAVSVPTVAEETQEVIIRHPGHAPQEKVLTTIAELEEEKSRVLDEMVGLEQGKTYQKVVALVEVHNLQNEITVDEVLKIAAKPALRDLGTEFNNILFRLFIWKDMLAQLWQERAFWGINWGRPQRSASIETLGWASTEWRKDGWIAPHNSCLHMVYRGGVVGTFLVIGFISTLIFLIKDFIVAKSLDGILLMSVFVYWLVLASCSVFLELPYSAIPFWTLLGIMLAYRQSLRPKGI